MILIIKFLYLFLVAHGVSAFVTSSKNSESQCIGSLTIAHEDVLRNVKYISLKGHRKTYPNVRKGHPALRRNIISHVEVIGNCCWELYPKRKFRGKKQSIFPTGSLTFPDFQPVSIRKGECSII